MPELTLDQLVNLPIAIVILIFVKQIAFKLIEVFKDYKDNSISNLCANIQSMTDQINSLVVLLTKYSVETEKNYQETQNSLNNIRTEINQIIEKIAKIEERTIQFKDNKL